MVVNGYRTPASHFGALRSGFLMNDRKGLLWSLWPQPTLHGVSLQQYPRVHSLSHYRNDCIWAQCLVWWISALEPAYLFLNFSLWPAYQQCHLGKVFNLSKAWVLHLWNGDTDNTVVWCPNEFLCWQCMLLRSHCVVVPLNFCVPGSSKQLWKGMWKSYIPGDPIQKICGGVQEAENPWVALMHIAGGESSTSPVCRRLPGRQGRYKLQSHKGLSSNTCSTISQLHGLEQVTDHLWISVFSFVKWREYHLSGSVVVRFKERSMITNLKPWQAINTWCFKKMYTYRYTDRSNQERS